MENSADQTGKSAMNNSIDSIAKAIKIQLKILDTRIGRDWPLPSYATPASAGVDLRACLDAPRTLAPGETVMVSAGICAFIADANFAAVILPRSGTGAKGLVLGNLVGLIDADYQGPITMALWNRSQVEITVNPGDRVAQLVVLPIARAQFELVNDFVATERGAGGYGSTGMR
jgi:dUTP pyrophosphatase